VDIWLSRRRALVCQPLDLESMLLAIVGDFDVEVELPSRRDRVAAVVQDAEYVIAKIGAVFGVSRGLFGDGQFHEARARSPVAFGFTEFGDFVELPLTVFRIG